VCDLYELFRFLFNETAALQTPAGALEVEPVHEVAVRVLAVEQLIRRREASHFSEQCRLVERPAIAPTRRLDNRCQVRLGDVQARQPHHLYVHVRTTNFTRHANHSHMSNEIE